MWQNNSNLNKNDFNEQIQPFDDKQASYVINRLVSGL